MVTTKLFERVRLENNTILGTAMAFYNTGVCEIAIIDRQKHLNDSPFVMSCVSPSRTMGYNVPEIQMLYIAIPIVWLCENYIEKCNLRGALRVDVSYFNDHFDIAHTWHGLVHANAKLATISYNAADEYTPLYLTVPHNTCDQRQYDKKHFSIYAEEQKEKLDDEQESPA